MEQIQRRIDHLGWLYRQRADSFGRLYRTQLLSRIHTAARPKPEQLEFIFLCDETAYRRYTEQSSEQAAQRGQLESAMARPGKRFCLPGYCYACQVWSPLIVSYDYAAPAENGRRLPNWRESLICERCGLNNRMRATMQLMEAQIAPPASARIYMPEYITPLFKWVSGKYPNTMGSEYLGDTVPFGSSSPEGVRNEDLTYLTFPDAAFDLVICLEVMEHIPDYMSAFRECARVLRPGGTMLLSVPFASGSPRNLVRATLHSDGSIEHHLPPEYHGDPVNSDASSLCFRHFGWEMLQELRTAGFSKAEAVLYWSSDYGHLGSEPIQFVARK